MSKSSGFLLVSTYIFKITLLKVVLKTLLKCDFKNFTIMYKCYRSNNLAHCISTCFVFKRTAEHSDGCQSSLHFYNSAIVPPPPPPRHYHHSSVFRKVCCQSFLMLEGIHLYLHTVVQTKDQVVRICMRFFFSSSALYWNLLQRIHQEHQQQHKIIHVSIRLLCSRLCIHSCPRFTFRQEEKI